MLWEVSQTPKKLFIKLEAQVVDVSIVETFSPPVVTFWCKSGELLNTAVREITVLRCRLRRVLLVLLYILFISA